jgi:hypothetical protein
MAPAVCAHQAPIPPPSYHRAMARALHLDTLTLVTRLQLLEVCRVAVQLAQRQGVLDSSFTSRASPPCERMGYPLHLFLVHLSRSRTNLHDRLITVCSLHA